VGARHLDLAAEPADLLHQAKVAVVRLLQLGAQLHDVVHAALALQCREQQRAGDREQHDREPGSAEEEEELRHQAFSIEHVPRRQPSALGQNEVLAMATRSVNGILAVESTPGHEDSLLKSHSPIDNPKVILVKCRLSEVVVGWWWWNSPERGKRL